MIDLNLMKSKNIEKRQPNGAQVSNQESFLRRKEVIQPHVPVRLPCYDFAPVIPPTFGPGCNPRDFGYSGLPWRDGRCVQDPGTYSPRHADPRLLAIPPSRRRVAACDPNWGRFSGICSPSRDRCPL